MLGKIIGGALKGAVKGAIGSAIGGKGGRDDSKIEKARTGAENKARGTKWSQNEQKGFELYKRTENPQAKPADFDALPKAQRQQYVEAGGSLGSRPKPGAAIADAFQASSELSSKGKDSSNLGNILGGLAEAFG